MKPLYFKIIEQGKETFIKVIRKGSHATAGIIVRSSGNFWATQVKLYDLDKKEDKEDYAALIEFSTESNREEFDQAAMQLLSQFEQLLEKRPERDN